MAVPLQAVPADERAVAAVAALVDEYDAIEVLVGLPLSMDGSEGRAAGLARDWSDALSAGITVPVRMVDERLTTVQAQRGLHAAGRSVRLTSHVPTPDPRATPAITAASAAAKAYVVGPSTSDRMRVHAISWSNDAKPERPSTTAGSQARSELTTGPLIELS